MRCHVEDGFARPGLDAVGRVVPLPAVTVEETYYDTPGLALAAAGVSLRRGADWTADLPRVPLRQHRPAADAAVPADLVDLLTAFHRGAPLAPVVTQRTVRTGVHVLSAAGGVLADLTDEKITVRAGGRVLLRAREIEVGGDPATVARIAALLADAGCTDCAPAPAPARSSARPPAPAHPPVPAYLRALGPPPGAEPVPPLGLAGGDATAGAVVTEALRAAIQRIFRHDPVARLRATMPGGATPVHQMRVGTRRLRSDLQTFQALLDPAWTRPLRVELGWLAAALGGARDVEVLRARLHDTAAADPLAPLDAAALDRIDAALTGRQETALAALDEALRSRRYVALLDALVTASRKPRLVRAARRRAGGDVLPAIVRKPWRRLAVAAAALTPDLPDDDWHEVRKLAKRARYAADAVAAVAGPDAARLAKRIAKAQRVLGEHQDAAIAADAWLFVAKFLDRGDHRLAVTAGRLFERERAAVTRARAAFPAVWAAVDEENTTAWLK